MIESSAAYLILVLERTILSPIISVLTAHMRYLLFCRFLTQMGIAGSGFYNCALSVYFVSVIKFGMQEKAFKKKIEFWCHFIPNAFAMGSSIFLQVKGYFNPMEGELFDDCRLVVKCFASCPF